ncbi:hypothetical protein niasHT_016675 [Heterodera trifolii]|uniref:PID domain-containing protein n=1 Tax=Heterodera trifolii TaxID=157864 RepID=A0ABD2KUF8_9BILA
MPSSPSTATRQQHQQNDLFGERRMSFGSELALQHGVHFEGKYIGSMEIARPGTPRNIKKRAVDIVVSVDGVKVVLQRRKKRQKYMDESKMLVMSHPMYRIYYVAHDLYDPQIFSYVARDGASNSFKCNVFKCVEKDQAIAVVRTIGQAFDLCNRMSQEQTRERQLLEEERTMDGAAGTAAASATAGTSTGGATGGAKGGGPRASVVSEKSTSSMGAQLQQQQQRHNSPPLGSKRHSIYVPRRKTTTTEELEEVDEQNTGDGDDEEEEEDEADETELFSSRRADAHDHHQPKPGPSSSSAAPLVVSSANISSVAAPAGIDQSQQRHTALPTSAGTSANPPPAAAAYYMQQQQPIASQLTMMPNQPPLAIPFSSATATTLWNFAAHQPHSVATPSVAPPPLPAQFVQSVDANGNPLYSFVPSPTAMSLSSPLLISPYATLQLPPSAASLASPQSSTDQLQSPSSCDNAQRAMIRSQLEQAQQSAQVAACQVQLLRDQLNTETTARLEAQSKTHQLLNSNRELLDQVQNLVGRLQIMENRMAEGLLNHLGDEQRKSNSRERRAQWRRDSGRRDGTLRPEEEEEEEHDRLSGRPGTSAETAAALAMGELRPYQLKTLSDLSRTDSVPTADAQSQQRKVGGEQRHYKQQRRDNAGEEEEEEEERRRRRGRRRIDSTDDMGTEDEEEEEEDADSTDVNSSAEHAAAIAVDHPSGAALPHARPAPAPSIFRRLIPASVPSSSGYQSPSTTASSVGASLGMPLLLGQQMANRATSPARRKPPHHQMAFSGPATAQRPPNDIVTPTGMTKKSLRRFSLQANDLEPEQHKVKKTSSSKGVFGQTEFKRMSFNTNPNKKMHDDKNMIRRPVINESEGEESYSGERRNSRTSPEKNTSSPERSAGASGGRRRSSLGVLGKIVGTNKALLSRLSLRGDLDTDH